MYECLLHDMRGYPGFAGRALLVASPLPMDWALEQGVIGARLGVHVLSSI